MKTKYLVLIADGMSDVPVKELKGKTPLEAANTPNMDFLAQNGTCGFILNVPSGMTPASDIAAMSIFGYDPKIYYTGRGPLEAVSLGIKMGKADTAFRCNFVTIKDGKMASFTSGHITTEESDKIIKTLNKKLSSKKIKFYTGLSYRHLMITDYDSQDVRGTPPHDITGKDIEKYLPKGRGSDLIKLLMKESIMHLLEHPVNIKRVEKGLAPATMIWLWGQGKLPKVKSFKKTYGKTGAVITAVHLLKGLGKILGMDAPDVPGATGFLDTNYEGKVSEAIRMLKKHDIVFLHVEAPDECGHMGDLKGKIKAIEDFDSRVVQKLLSWAQRQSNTAIKILVLPDHPTPVKSMKHTSDPVPFVIYDSKKSAVKEKIRKFSEKEIKKSKLYIRNGHGLMRMFLG